MREPDVSQLISVREAIEVIDREPAPPRVVEMPLAEADGLVLAEEVQADRDYPPIDKSQMDGFAVRCGDVKSGVDLRVIGEVAAGEWPARAVEAGEAMAIMTGAPMPDGADGVAPVEDTQRNGERVRIDHAPTPGRYIARRGSDIAAGSIVLEKGQRLGSAQIAVAASVGKARVKVYARPRVAVLGTGDELVEVSQTPGNAQIRNSNNPMLVSLLNRLGCEVVDMGIAKDEPSAIRDKLEAAMSADVIFVSGGMSMGEHDYVPRILLKMGVKFRVTKLRVKPGKPFVFGVGGAGARRVFVFGLPGNPLSGFVCVVRLASRLLARLSGDRVREPWREGRLENALAANGPREFYQPVILEEGTVRVLGWKGSADLYSLAKANALLVRAENEPARPAGDTVRVLEVPS